MSNKKGLGQLPMGPIIIGTIMPFALSANSLEGSGWLLCDGSKIDLKYKNLITTLESKNTPNLQGLTLIGSGDSYDLGGTGGEEAHTLTMGEIPAHDHNYIYSDVAFGADVNSGGSEVSNSVKSTTDNTGGGKAHNNMQPYQVINYIIYTGQNN